MIHSNINEKQYKQRKRRNDFLVSVKKKGKVQFYFSTRNKFSF